MSEPQPQPPVLLYCDCREARVVPADVKAAVLKELCDAGVSFEAVPDLCEWSARRHPALRRLASAGPIKVAACFPRAVKGLFEAARAPLQPGSTEVVNMRVLSAAEAVAAMRAEAWKPNLPAGKETVPATSDPS